MATSLGLNPPYFFCFFFGGGGHLFCFFSEDKRQKSCFPLKKDIIAYFSVSPIPFHTHTHTHTHTLSLSLSLSPVFSLSFFLFSSFLLCLFLALLLCEEQTQIITFNGFLVVSYLKLCFGYNIKVFV